MTATITQAGYRVRSAYWRSLHNSSLEREANIRAMAEMLDEAGVPRQGRTLIVGSIPHIQHFENPGIYGVDDVEPQPPTIDGQVLPSDQKTIR